MLGRAVQRVIAGVETVLLVPAIERLPHRIIEQPALAAVHARLINLMPEQVVAILHDEIAAGINDPALVTLNVELDLRRVKLVSDHGSDAVSKPIMSDGVERSSERIKIRHAR